MAIAGASVGAPSVSVAQGDHRGLTELRYVANAGVQLAFGLAKVLIDAPIRDGIPPYTTSSAGDRLRLERAQPPHDGVAAILVTHWHEDHFSPRQRRHTCATAARRC